MTETVLLGNVAYPASAAFDWKADTLDPVGARTVKALLDPRYRKGWQA